MKLNKKTKIIVSAAVLVVGCALSAVISSLISAGITKNSYESKLAKIEADSSQSQVQYATQIQSLSAMLELSEEDLLAKMFPSFDPRKVEATLEGLGDDTYYASLTYTERSNAVCAAYLNSLDDPYASFYTADEWSDANSSTYTGIGVQVVFDTERGAVQVVTPFPGTPADEAGILPGDYIVGVAGTTISDLTSAVSLIRGEEGTDVTVTVERNGVQFEVTMTRKKVINVSVMYHTIEATASTPKTGYIKILEFNGTDSTTALQFLAAVEALEAEGVESYIFDVRYCPGGDLYSVLNIINFILPADTDDLLANIDYTTDREDIVVTAWLANYWIAIAGRTNISYSQIKSIEKPIVVLVNGSTASGGELFASAIKDYAERGKINATLIGTQTFGKGIMQTISEFTDGTAFKLTVAYYNPPYSQNYHGVGVAPDIVLDLDEALKDKNIYKITDEEDNQIQAALSHLASEVSK